MYEFLQLPSTAQGAVGDAVSTVSKFLTDFTNIIVIAISSLVTYIMQKVRSELATVKTTMAEDFARFKTTMIEERSREIKELSNLFLPRPPTDGEWPLTRREFEAYVLGAKEYRVNFEKVIEKGEERNRSLGEKLLKLEAELASLREKKPVL